MSAHLLVAWRKLASGTLWHLTDKANFALKPGYVPVDNALSIRERAESGLYLASDLSVWVNGHGYLRPFAVEVRADPSALRDERWGGEKFLPAEHFDRAEVVRVIPIDAWVRETYGEYGWVEDHHGTTFDTDEPLPEGSWGNPGPLPEGRGYRYTGPDVRSMDSATVARHKERARAARKGRA